MLPIARLLHKTVVRKFYERNTGFFLFIFFLMFGIVESTQIVYYHLSLIYGIIQSTIFLTIVCLLWALYIAKCFFFVMGFIASEENSFLLQMNQLPYQKRTGWLFYTFTLIDLPVIIYCSLIVGVAGRQGFYGMAAFIVLFQIALLLTASVVLERRLTSLKPSSFTVPAFRINTPLPFSFYYLSALLHRHKTVFILTKVFSFFAIIGFMSIPLDHYEYRAAMMGLLFGMAAHAVVVFEFRKMEDHYLVFARQLPVPLLARFSYLLIAYGVLLLPELVLILSNHIALADGILIYFGGMAFLIFSHCSLYKRGLDMDRHILYTLILFLAGFGLILFSMALPAVLILLLVSYYRFQKNYYRFESAADLG